MSYIDNTIQGWMSPEELLGAWRGKSTHALLSGRSGTVYVVDHWLGTPSERHSAHKDAATQDIYKQFMKNVGHFPRRKREHAESRSCEWSISGTGNRFGKVFADTQGA